MLALSEPPSLTFTLNPHPCSLAGDTLDTWEGEGQGGQVGMGQSQACQ